MSAITSSSQRLSIGWFAREVLGRPLYPYQECIGDAILDSIFAGHGYTFTVMLARQMGKNQLSAVLEAYLLFCCEQGSLVKAAPTFKPQIINSRQRLLHMLESPLTNKRVWKSFGYIIGLAPDPTGVEAQIGPRIMFFSAGPDSNIVGATASLLLEVDEAQDVDSHKYDVELKPMASTTNATTVLYGTAWSEDTLLAKQKAHNLMLEEGDGIRRHFEFDWRHLAAINPRYKRFVEGEIARLGEEHLSIRTQYRLLSITGAGLLLNELQRRMLVGTHDWEETPDEESLYIAGMDVGGEERPRPEGEQRSSNKRDATVITIGKVSYNELNLPRIEIVHQLCWTGMRYLDQYAATIALMEQWRIHRLVIDQTGLGEGLTSLLIERLGDERVIAFRFSRPSKSRLTYQLLGMINSARLKLSRSDKAPQTIYEECWQQLRRARYRVPSEGIMDMYVEATEGHDDFLLSLALCCEAAREISAPISETRIIRPRPLYNDGYF